MLGSRTLAIIIISITSLLLVSLLDDVMDDVVTSAYQAKQSTYSPI